MSLVLASRSATRARMLEMAGVPFSVVASALDEDEAKGGLARAGFAPREMAEMLAEMKAAGAGEAGSALVLGSDQILECDDGSVLSKAGSRAEAAEQLRNLSGRIHRLHAGAVVIESGARIWGYTETAKLRMRTLSAEFVQSYLDDEYEDVRFNVGVYRIECRGAQLFESIDGSHFAVLGMPLLPLLAFLRTRGILDS